MADPLLLIPTLNPIKYVKQTPYQKDIYNSLHMDDHYLERMILEFEEEVEYAQPWQTSDTIRQQFYSNYGPFRGQVIDRYGQVVKNFDMVQVLNDLNHPEFWIYEHNLPLEDIEDGIYWIQMFCGQLNGNPLLRLTSSALHIAGKHAHSLHFAYKHPTYKDGMYFKGGFYPEFRVQGHLKFKSPNGVRNVYNDQVYNAVNLSHKRFRTFTLHIGDSFGVPDDVSDRMEAILGCPTLVIDGREYTVPESAKLDANEVDHYPMRGWTIELRERYNRSGITFIGGDEVTDPDDNGNPALAGSSIIIVTDSQGFSNDQNGQNNYEVIDVQ